MSTASMQENAPAACSAVTVCEMSSTRLRKPMQRLRAAAASKVLPRGFSCFMPGPILSDVLPVVGPVVVAGVARLLEERDPTGGVVVVLGREDPFLEQALLLGVVVRVHLHEPAAGREALDLPQTAHHARTVEVVDGVDAQDRGERLVGERQV